ncbi:MAG: Na+/H+ antiporter NhaC family protein [Culicoidibacterales bacterium]
MELLLTLFPPLVIIVLVFSTKRVLLSLSGGILAALLVLVQGNLLAMPSLLIEYAMGILTDIDTMLLFAFIIILAGSISIAHANGGTKALAQWMFTKVRTPKQAKLFGLFAGIFIFLDDTFSTQIVGPVTRELADENKISRAELAYIIDTTSASVSSAMPISSWTGLLIGSLATTALFTNASQAYFSLLMINFYSITAIVVCFLSIWFNIQIGSMKKVEMASLAGKDPSKWHTDDAHVDHGRSNIWNILLPLFLTTIATVGMFAYTGYVGAADSGITTITFIDIISNMNSSLSLFVGSLVTFITVTIQAIFVRLSWRDYYKAMAVESMGAFGTVMILVLAFIASDMIKALGLGEQLGMIIQNLQVPFVVLPLIFLGIAGFFSFVAGTSWGTISLFVPIVALIVNTIAPEMVLVSLAAVVSGAVFGDHASPLNGNTILSAAGAQCQPEMHFETQMPYALVGLVITAFAFIVLTLTSSALLAWLAVGIGAIIFVLVAKYIAKRTTVMEHS